MRHPKEILRACRDQCGGGRPSRKSPWELTRALKMLGFLSTICVAELNAAIAPGQPLVWDLPSQSYTVKPGEISAHFIFKVANVSDATVTIDDVKTSCGCTVAQLPMKPWHLAPKETNKMEVLVDVRGKTGVLFKQINVLSTNAPKLLTVLITIPPEATNGMSGEMANRLWGQQLAATDHQEVFKNDCVKCHLIPAFGKMGQPLYQAACGICHEAVHRATMVPDLHA